MHGADPSYLPGKMKLEYSLPSSALSRRAFLVLAGAIGCALPASEARRGTTNGLDKLMGNFMRERRIPGAVLAVVKDGRLVHAAGYGLADRDYGVPTSGTSLFRIASLSKPITAAAVLKLAAEGKLSLDSPAFEMLEMVELRKPGVDSRLHQIKVRHLLQHTGGWDRQISGDPMFAYEEISKATGWQMPFGPRRVIEYMVNRPLDFAPGTRYAYSNFGYCVLGRVIEAVTGMPYVTYVRQQVLAPMGISRMRMAGSLVCDRAPNEVAYYTPEANQVRSVFPQVSAKVPVPYGAFSMEIMDAHGGWLASGQDLARFLAGLTDARPGALLGAKVMASILEPPSAPAWRNPDGTLEDAYYGGGWMVRPKGANGRPNLWHTGCLPGTYTLMVQRGDGIGYAALFNQRSRDWETRDTVLDPLLYRAVDKVTNWPEDDLFNVNRAS